MIDFNKLIDSYLVREYKPKSIGKYYPSEAGGCIRKTWFSYKNPKELTASLLKIFEAGNMLHEFVTEVLKNEKNKEVELLRSELPVKIERKDFVISGRVDNLVLLKIENKEYLVEVKSTRLLPYTKPNVDHVMQLQLYMYAINVHNGIVLYIEKDNLLTKWFEIEYNQKEVDEILQKYEKLHELLIKNELPKPEAQLNPRKKWMCNFCSYLDECKKDWDKFGI